MVAAVVVAAGEHRLVIDGRDAAPLELADTRRARRRGLLGRDAIVGALMISPCRCVHTVGMRFAIDVAHVSADGTVLRTTTMAPGRVGRPVLRARHVVEAGAGSFAAWGLRTGCSVGCSVGIGQAPGDRRP